MAKIAERYLELHPWEIIEEGFHPDRGRVSESVFSLANEFMGVRGFFEEGYSGDKLTGSYVNGVFEEKETIHPALFKGFSTRFCFMVNTVDWLYTRLSVDGEKLDLAVSRYGSFKRTLDMKKGVLIRELIWETTSGKSLLISFRRFLSMVHPNMGLQKITFKPLNFSGKIEIETGLDFNPVHELEGRNFWHEQKYHITDTTGAILCATETSRQQLFSGFCINTPQPLQSKAVKRDKYAGIEFELELKEGHETYFEKIVANHAERQKDADPERVWIAGLDCISGCSLITYDAAFDKQVRYWQNAWDKLDIAIEGDDINQQGVRFCIFNLQQTYHGGDATLNVGAKGLTGEFYFGWTWWDTETYCLPFYMFSNPKAARSLLEYRYNTLPQARERAKEMDCEGSCYPMGTIDGTESCGTWQHGNLEIHVSAAIPYGIWHYDRVCNDKEFLYEKGLEMLLEAGRYFASRGAWGAVNGKYGYYGVMGPDEFHMMVNNNCYTNLLAKKTFEFALETIENARKHAPEKYTLVINKVGITKEELADWKNKAENMFIPFNNETGLFEQHDGYFNLPYIDVRSIPYTEFPIYKNWEYGRIFRTSMTKQPDVLLFLFFYSQQYSMDVKRANYDFYEPRCSHESSLSPAIHSILACELGKMEEAVNFTQYASRLDLDDYNRNTHEGLHITSMAATWMNMVYGFGGMRSDGDMLALNPNLPPNWDSYSFKIYYKNTVLHVKVGKETVILKTTGGESICIKVFGKVYTVDCNGIEVELEV